MISASRRILLFVDDSFGFSVSIVYPQIKHLVSSVNKRSDQCIKAHLFLSFDVSLGFRLHIIHILYIYSTYITYTYSQNEIYYTTLAPKFFCCNQLAITQRIKHLNQKIRNISKAQDLYYNVAVSKHDSKHIFQNCACALGFEAWAQNRPCVRCKHKYKQLVFLLLILALGYEI